jgi:hypothetical protein
VHNSSRSKQQQQQQSKLVRMVDATCAHYECVYSETTVLETGKLAAMLG